LYVTALQKADELASAISWRLALPTKNERIGWPSLLRIAGNYAQQHAPPAGRQQHKQQATSGRMKNKGDGDLGRFKLAYSLFVHNYFACRVARLVVNILLVSTLPRR
jgi:hypothetical protein